MNKRSPSAERLYRARKAAAKELKLPVIDWRVRRYGLLMVAHDNITARLANGADVNVDQLLKVEGAMQEIRSSVPAPAKSLPKMEIEFVKNVTGIFTCQFCHKRNEIPDHHPLQPPEPPEPPSLPPAPMPPTGGEPATGDALPVASPSGDNVVPLRPVEKTASFTGVCEPWRRWVGAVGGGDSPFSAGPPPGGGRS